MVILQKNLERISLEFALTTINILVNGLERLDIIVDHLLSSPVSHEDLSTEYNQPILRCL